MILYSAVFSIMLALDGSHLTAPEKSGIWEPRLVTEANQRIDPPSPSQTLSVTGTIERGASCPLIKADDGRVYSLSGLSGGYENLGKRMTVSGQIAMLSKCQQGQEIRVENSALVKQ